MKQKTIISIIIGICVILILMGVFSVITSKTEDTITFMECCNSKVCSDTYYTYPDNKCHLSLCENSAFTNKSQCVYEGANKSIEFLGELR